MSLPSDFLQNLTSELRQLLKHAGVTQADIHVQMSGHAPQQGTIHANEGDQRDNNEGRDGTTIYAIGSLTKVLIALLMSIIVDQLSCSTKPEDEHYRQLRRWNRDPWGMSFTTLFNYFSDTKISPLPGNPTLRHILLHFNSLLPMNWILLAPEGTSLMSIKEFLEVAPLLTQAADRTHENYLEYSNGNYILIGLLIKAIAAPQQDTLEGLMAQYIFKPLGMTRTYMNRSELGAVPFAQPHVFTLRGRPELIDAAGYPADAIVNLAMGAFSCPRDLAILLREFLRSINREESIFTRDFVRHLLKPEALLDDSERDAHTMCGISTTMDTSIPGSKSINRLITPTEVYSTYRVGQRPRGKQLKVYYQAGAVNGYASCFYLIPKQSTFVIVLTNTSGRIDATDHISRLILQRLFNLKRPLSYLTPLSKRLFDKSLDLKISDLKPKVDIVNMSSRAAEKGQKVLEAWDRADTQEDIPNVPQLLIDGTYKNELTKQTIIIRKSDGRLIANIKGAGGTSRDIGLHRTGAFKFRLYPLNNVFTIDRYDPHGWNEVSFDMSAEEDKDEDGNRRVAKIERHGALLTDAYIRIQRELVATATEGLLG
jgi:CubicO group peptidase (beta-lactamase class C family)